MTEEGSRKRKSSGVNGIGVDDEQDISTSCPYLDTIQRSLLDFDFEPACSVSMQTGPHIYGCLVCGKYFRGRGPQTPAYTHSVEESHFVFVHLSKGTFHCLPDDYQVKDSSLQDISAALRPTFSPLQVATIDSSTDLPRDLFGRRYLPGFVGLNNLNKTDCVNAVVQALAHVRPLRDFFLRQDETQAWATAVAANNKKSKTATPSSHRLSQHVAQCFGQVVRRLWSDKRFKSHVDPHMLVQAITAASKTKYQVGQQAEAGEFITWFLHQLHVGTGGTRKPGSSIVHKVFQGKVRVTTRQAKKQKAVDEEQDRDERAGSDNEYESETAKDTARQGMVVEETTTDTRFLQLTLDIPEKPLFRDEDGGLVIPQEPLVNVLKKFDGVTLSDAIHQGSSQRKFYKLLKLPNYLILHLARFTTNRYSREKNPTIVAFPVKNLDLSDYVTTKESGGKPKLPTETEIQAMSVSYDCRTATKQTAANYYDYSANVRVSFTLSFRSRNSRPCLPNTDAATLVTRR